MILQTVLATMMRALISPQRKNGALPDELRGYFSHLYWDVVWFGIVAGSSQAFLGVYMARLGATPFQMGLLSAGPALVGLIFTMPAGAWLRNRIGIGKVVFWAAVVMRVQFLLWIFLPSLLPPQAQIWSVLATILIFSIPSTILAIAFNAMYAAAVPLEYRQEVAANRNALIALVFVAASLVSGWLLDNLPDTIGYQVVFALGFIGAAMSAYHLYQLRSITTESIHEPEKIRSTIGDMARPGDMRMGGMTRPHVGLRAFSRVSNLLRAEVLKGGYGKIVAALFVFHFAQFLPAPVIPLFWVDVVQFTDWEIGMGTAIFHAALFIGSLMFVRFSRFWDNRRWTAIGAVTMGLYPIMVAYSYSVPWLLITSFLGGAAWSISAATLGNYLLEQAPEGDRPAYLAWYNLALSAAVLLGSLGGSLLAEVWGMIPLMLFAGTLRMLAGVAVWKWH